MSVNGQDVSRAVRPLSQAITNANTSGALTKATVGIARVVLDYVILESTGANAGAVDFTVKAKGLTLIAPADATLANLNADGEQVAWEGALGLDVGDTVTWEGDAAGSGAASTLRLVIGYHAETEGGMLS